MTEIIEFSATEAALIKMEEHYGEMPVPDVETKEGFEKAKSIAKEIRSYSIKLEAMRKELKAPIIERGKLLDFEAKCIDARLKSLALPFKEEVDRKEREIKEAEDRRISAIEKRLDEMRMLVDPISLSMYNPETLEAIIMNLESSEMRGWQEYETKAYETRNKVLIKLNEQFEFLVEQAELRKQLEKEQKRQSEEKAAAQAELDAIRKEREELEALKRELEAKNDVGKPIMPPTEPEKKDQIIDADDLPKYEMEEALDPSRFHLFCDLLVEVEGIIFSSQQFVTDEDDALNWLIQSLKETVAAGRDTFSEPEAA